MSKRMSHPSCSWLESRGWAVRMRRDSQDHSRCVPILSGPSTSPSCFSGDGEKRKSCQRLTAQGFQLCISVHLKDLTALFLQCLCLIFLHMQVFWSTFLSGEPLRSTADLTVYSLLPPHPGWVWKSLYWDQKCDRLFALLFLAAHLAIKWSNHGQVCEINHKPLLYLLVCFWRLCNSLHTFSTPPPPPHPSATSWAC